MRQLAMPLGALLFGLTAPAFAQAPPTGGTKPFRGKRLLYVMRSGRAGSVTDMNVKKHLEFLGFSVTLADQTEPATRAEGQDLVAISASVQAHTVAGRYKHSTVPIVTWENDVLDDMSMAGKRHDADFGDVPEERFLWLVNAPHPLSAGLPAGTTNVFTKAGRMGWGKPGLGAIIIATLPGHPDKGAIFAYEKGATMDYDFLAPDRRVFLFLDDVAFDSLNQSGLALFNAVLHWAVRSPSSQTSP